LMDVRTSAAKTSKKVATAKAKRSWARDQAFTRSTSVKYVEIPTPIGLRLEVPVKECKKIDAERAMACVVKDTGDDFMDVRDGIKICAIVRLFEGSGGHHKGREGLAS